MMAGAVIVCPGCGTQIRLEKRHQVSIGISASELMEKADTHVMSIVSIAPDDVLRVADLSCWVWLWDSDVLVTATS